MELISKFNKVFRFSLCVIDTYIKYAWVILWKDRQGTTIMNAFRKILKESNRKPNKIWVYKGSKFYNGSCLEKKKYIYIYRERERDVFNEYCRKICYF